MDKKEFIKLLKKAENGDDRAMYLVGLAYETGDGVEANIEEAAAWMKGAYELGNKDAKAWLEDYYFDDDPGIQTHS